MRGGGVLGWTPLPPSLYPKHPLHPCYLNLMYPPNLSPSVRAGLVGLTIFRIFTLKTHPDPTHTLLLKTNKDRYNQDTTLRSCRSYILEVILNICSSVQHLPKQTRQCKQKIYFCLVIQ